MRSQLKWAGGALLLVLGILAMPRSVEASKQIYSGEPTSNGGVFTCNCTVCSDHGCFCIMPGP